ncbi:segregation and condensation protein B [Listeria booriae]|uniref:segregation and condensation protein B n=1 Tax=Listeria booriae TaxID=1552123 RepID=UPI001626D796|nr:segregation and condensation protein B [Listeria booriae]MBC2149491.1 segregation and condensation protein B [Listeria booriae]
MFEVESVSYTLRFNKQKLKTIEMTTKSSVMGEMVKNGGALSMQLLEALFTFGLVKEKGLVAVPQTEAAEIYDKVVETNGFMSVTNAVITKLQEDMGFMFR